MVSKTLEKITLKPQVKNNGSHKYIRTNSIRYFSKKIKNNTESGYLVSYQKYFN